MQGALGDQLPRKGVLIDKGPQKNVESNIIVNEPDACNLSACHNADREAAMPSMKRGKMERISMPGDAREPCITCCQLYDMCFSYFNISKIRGEYHNQQYEEFNWLILL